MAIEEQAAPAGHEATEEHIVRLIQEAFDEWDRIHGNGWNRDYLKVVPSPFHQAARAICKELSLEAKRHT